MGEWREVCVIGPGKNAPRESTELQATVAGLPYMMYFPEMTLCQTARDCNLAYLAEDRIIVRVVIVQGWYCHRPDHFGWGESRGKRLKISTGLGN